MTTIENGHRTLAAWTIPVRITVAIAVFAGGLMLLVSLAPSGATSDSTLVARIVEGAALSIAVIGVIVLLTRVVARRPLRTLGMTGPLDAWRAALTGAVAWTIPAVLTFAVFALLGMPIAASAPAADLFRIAVLVALAVLLSEAIPEELVFRGFVTAVLGERLRGWWVIIVQAALFTAVAVLLRGGVDPLDLSLFVAMGIGLGYLRQVTDSVWTTVGFHLAFQTGSQLLLNQDVIDFGGSTLHAMIGLGVVPFAVGVTLLSAAVSTAPALFARQRR